MSANVLDASAARLFIAVDHTTMMEQIDGILRLMAAPEPDVPSICAGLDALAGQTREHFDREGEIMRFLTDQDAEAHRRDHARLLRSLIDFTEAIRSGDKPVSMTTALDLDTWLMFHIQCFDAKLIAACGA